MLSADSENTPPMFRLPHIFTRFEQVTAAESTRHGGVSPAPFHSLNLGGTQDLPDNVLENNHRFFGALHVPFETVAKSHQVHDDKILNVTLPGRYEGYDALITNVSGIQLAVTVADCTPILVFDPVQNACAAIHAGWRGTVAGIVYKTISEMQQQFGTRPEECVGYVGTCIDECSFEVGEEVAGHFSEEYKRWDAGHGKFFVDLKAANRAQLVNAGLLPENVEVSSFSTVLDNADYFSYRHEKGVTGRLLATIGVKSQLS